MRRKRSTLSRLCDQLTKSLQRMRAEHVACRFERCGPPASLSSIVIPFTTMASADVYGFAHGDLETARRAIENALSIRLEEAQESMPPGGCYFRGAVPSGPWVQLRRNGGAYLRWQGDPSHPWYPEYGVLMWAWGPAKESIAQRLQHDVPGLSFLEKKETM